MVQCTTCGTVAADTSPTCSQCGHTLPANGNGDATAIIPETVAIPITNASRPRSTPSIVRNSIVATVDEGRFLPGTLIAGRYRIIGLLGRGGMGEVYRATDLALAQSVALKILPEDAATNQQLLERFHSEVRIARQVSHPNVCRVYDLGEADGIPFISMEYVDGEDLAVLLQRIGRLPSDKALEIARKLCAGLAAAHERGVIHRDLKPQNIMLNKRGEVIIMDFGLAAVADQLHGPEARNGTPAYMSPEQLRGDSVTAKSDLYALGLIFYELFTGKRAYEAKTVAELIRMQEVDRPASMTTIAAEIDPGVERVILRCLNPDPAMRPATPLSVSAALPGGDPLAAALAAGETPSPELVAASGNTKRLALRYAIPCLAFVLLSLLCYPFLLQSVAVTALSPVEFPGVVLSQKAREMAAGFGYPDQPRDWISGFEIRSDYLGYLKRYSQQQRDWRRWYRAESPVWFFYRQSPIYLAAPPDGDPDLNRPPPTSPGMVTVILDSRGLLRRFQAIAPRVDDNAPSLAVPDAADLFKRAGLDLARFHEVTPRYIPSLPFDARRAWAGDNPALPGAAVTVEAATFRGKLTSFYIQWPWALLPKPGEVPAQESQSPFWTVFSVAFLVSGLLAVSLLARANLRKNRGDRKGAFRIAAAVCLLNLTDWLLTLHVIPSGEMMEYVFINASVAVTLGSLAWLLYLALEPAVRARWPHALIAWNRLLAGSVGDPRVGSHILLGAVIGLVLRWLLLLRTYWMAQSGLPPAAGSTWVLSGFNYMLASMLNVSWRSVIAGSVIFFLLTGLRAALRFDWLAAVAAAFILTLQEGGFRNSPNMLLDLPVYLGAFGTLAFALLRIGMVPAIAAFLTLDYLGNMPVSADFSSWINSLTLLPLLVVAAIAIYGFWRSQSDVGGIQAATER